MKKMTPYEKRREALEAEGMTTSDAQAVIEAEDNKKKGDTMKTEKGKQESIELTCFCQVDDDGKIERMCSVHAAAPELLEACIAVFGDIQLNAVKGGSDQLYQMIEKAIAKAEGRAE